MSKKYVKLTHKNYAYKRLSVEGELSAELESILPNDRNHLCGAFFCKRDELSRWINTYILTDTKDINFEPTIMRYIWDIEIPEGSKITDNDGKLSADTYVMYNKRFIWTDHDLCIELIHKNPELLKYAQCKFTQDEYIEIVRSNGLVLRHISKKYQSFDLCQAAIDENPEAKLYVKIKMKKGKNCKKNKSGSKPKGKQKENKRKNKRKTKGK